MRPLPELALLLNRLQIEQSTRARRLYPNRVISYGNYHSGDGLFFSNFSQYFNIVQLLRPANGHY